MVTCPAFVAPSVTLPGCPKFTWLNTLKTSTRNSIFALDTATLRDNAMSTFRNPGPRRYPLGVFPHRPGVFWANAAMLNHCSAVRTAVPRRRREIRIDAGHDHRRSVAARPVSAESPVVAGVSGEPLRACNTVPSCQSRVSVFTKPVAEAPAHHHRDMLKMCGRSAAHGPSLVDGSFGSGKLLTMSVPGSPWLMHLLRV